MPTSNSTAVTIAPTNTSRQASLANQPGNGTYAAAAAVPRTITVAKAVQTITFAMPEPAYVGDPAFVPNATSSSGLAVTIASTTTGICTVTAPTVNFVAAGNCTLNATQAGNANYAAATLVGRTFAVGATRPVQVYYVHPDQIGTPRAVTMPQTNTVVWKMDNTEVFGANAANEDPDNNGSNFVYPLRFAGQYYDKETATSYNYFRDYDPSVGRYVQSDPIGLAGGVNTYAYVGGNPVAAIDANGLEIAYANHSVFGGLAAHSKFIITPIDQAKYANDPRFQNIDATGKRFATIGAGPDRGPRLTSGVNRSRDVSMPNTYKTALDLPCTYANENDAIDNLFKLAAKYNDNAFIYTLFPHNVGGVPTGYNSNSFVSGLGASAGFSMPEPSNTGAYTPGYQNPIPASRFIK